MTDILAPAPPAAAIPPGLTGERKRLWSSRPSRTVILCLIADLLIIPTLAANGILMTPLPLSVVAGVFAACIALALVLDQVKLVIFARLRMM